MGESTTKQVHIRVAKATKEDWEEHAESFEIGGESKYGGMTTNLIKHAVDQQIRRDLGDATSGSTTTAPASDGGEVLSTVKDIQNRMADLETIVENLERFHSVGGGVDSETLTEVYRAVPSAPERATTAEGIAEGLDVDSDLTRIALENLEEAGAVFKREIQTLDEAEGTTTIETHLGDEVVVEDPGTAFNRRNPLWYKGE